MTYDLGGFSITQGTQITMVVIFAIYTIIIVGLGLYVKAQSKKTQTDNLASFLTGGGGLGAFAIAMIAATNSMAGGTMVTAPGLTYAIGFSGALIYYAGFLTAAFGIGSIGRKSAILRDRTGAVSFLDFFRLRFQSKAVVGALAITSVIGLVFTACGQITGSNQYYVGLLLVIIITIVYTMSGGIKSMAKIAVIQGVVMLCATFSIMGVLLYKNAQTYGSIVGALEYMGTTYPSLLQANTSFSFLNALGTALFVGVGLGTLPNAVGVSLTYNNQKSLKRGVIISCLIFTIVQGLMCATGPFAHLLNPDLVTRDYTTIYVASNLLPSWVAGIIFCGVFAAIQSSIAGYCMAAAAGLTKDFVVNCYMPEASTEKQMKYNNIAMIGIAVVASLIAIKPTDLTQYMINFALGSLAAAWYWPVLLGLYWKKATKKGMFWSTVGGFVAYIVFYFLSSIIPVTKAWWVANLGNMHAFIPAWLIGLALLYFVSLATQNDRVPLGYFQVFFCDDYDEAYAKDYKLK